MNDKRQIIYHRCDVAAIRGLLDGELSNVIRRLQEFLDDNHSVQIDTIKKGNIGIEILYSRPETDDERDKRIAKIVSIAKQEELSEERMEQYLLHLKNKNDRVE